MKRVKLITGLQIEEVVGGYKADTSNRLKFFI